MIEATIFKLIVLLTVHCVADYPLQGDFLANFKGKNFFLLCVHSMIWSGMIFITLTILGVVPVTLFPFLFFGHIVIDRWKCNRKDKTKALTKDLYIDQFLHLLQICYCVFILQMKV